MEKEEVFKKKVVSIFKKLKFESDDTKGNLMIPIFDENHKHIGNLKTISIKDVTDDDLVRFLADWRAANNIWFNAQFKVTFEGTKKWAKEQLIDREDRILFWIQTISGERIGHIGLSSFNFKENSCEMDNLIRGKETPISNIVLLAYNALKIWAFTVLKVSGIYARLFADNNAAKFINLSGGLKEIYKIPAKKVIENGILEWKELPRDTNEKADRFVSVMYLKNAGII